MTTRSNLETILEVIISEIREIFLECVTILRSNGEIPAANALASIVYTRFDSLHEQVFTLLTNSPLLKENKEVINRQISSTCKELTESSSVRQSAIIPSGRPLPFGIRPTRRRPRTPPITPGIFSNPFANTNFNQTFDNPFRRSESHSSNTSVQTTVENTLPARTIIPRVGIDVIRTPTPTPGFSPLVVPQLSSTNVESYPIIRESGEEMDTEDGQ